MIEASAHLARRDTRLAMLQKIMGECMNELIWIPLYFLEDSYAYRSDLEFRPRVDRYVMAPTSSPAVNPLPARPFEHGRGSPPPKGMAARSSIFLEGIALFRAGRGQGFQDPGARLLQKPYERVEYRRILPRDLSGAPPTGRQPRDGPVVPDIPEVEQPRPVHRVEVADLFGRDAPVDGYLDVESGGGSGPPSLSHWYHSGPSSPLARYGGPKSAYSSTSTRAGAPAAGTPPGAATSAVPSPNQATSLTACLIARLLTRRCGCQRM